MNPMEQRLIYDAKSECEAARLRALFELRAGVIRRFLLSLLLLPAVMLLGSLLLFRSDAVEGQRLPVEDDHISTWHEEEERLLEHIRKYYLYQPAPRAESYQLVSPDLRDHSQKGQSLVVDDILQGRRKGFFFEAGAYDGETYSNSLYFEKYLNWTGVMVEPDMGNIGKFLAKKRKCFLVRGCIGQSQHPEKVTFYASMDVGVSAEYMSNLKFALMKLWRPIVKFQTWCWPLISILKAVGHTKIDYMILDVEGNELPIMRATNWSNIDVDVFQVEYMMFQGIGWAKDESHANLKEMRNYFSEKQKSLGEHSRIWLDLIYAKKGILATHPHSFSPSL